jgi:vacuolar-type H+-ATPase subunit D/Vma8
MNIKEMKSKRDALHEELHALLAEYKPKEKEIRDQIKEIQEELYKREMTPVAQKLKFDVAKGS